GISAHHVAQKLGRGAVERTLGVRQQNCGQRGITKHQGGGVAFWPTRTWERARRRTQQEAAQANSVPKNGRSASTAVMAGGRAAATRLSRLGLKQTKRLRVLMPHLGLFVRNEVNPE